MIQVKVHILIAALAVLSQYSWLDTSSSTPVYFASFVISDSKKKNKSYHDDLVYWRTYGDAARGCSIELFSASRDLKRVLYGKHNVEVTAQLLEEFLNRIAPLVELPPPIGQGLADLAAEAINSIRYLYKSEDYQYENECRLIVLRDRKNLANIHFDYRQAHGGSTSVRHYCYDGRLEMRGILEATGTSITIGPAAPSQDALERTIHVALKKLGIYGAAVMRSEIGYRTS
ncbi:MAG: DUF2971 domain-containing protein [Gemmatimonadetes bacterium]|nr:DUF2971 domain-containing protein [Gemmatimonadota bacterium]